MYCIYMATNKTNLKKYIGYSSDFNKRIKSHKHFAFVKNKNNKFYEALREYGWSNFEWEIIFESWDKYYCLTVAESLLIKEYDTIKNGYNLLEGGNGGRGGSKGRILTENEKKIISERTKIGMSNMSQEDKERMLFSIRNPSEETKQKMSQAKKGKESTFKGKSQPESAKLKISNSTKKSWENEETRNKILEHIQNPTEETRKKMSEAKIGKSSWNKGVKGWQSEETFEKKRITMEKKKQEGWINPKKGTKCSEESKKKMRNKGVSIEILDSNMNRVGILNGNYDMRENGFNPSCVYKVVSGTYSQYKGYIFRKLSEKHISYSNIKVI